MKKYILVVLVSITLQALFSAEKKDVTFSELFLSHNSRNGKTELVLYDVKGDFPVIEQVNDKIFMTSHFELSSYEVTSEEFSTSKNILSVKVTLTARNPLLHKKNLMEILSNVLDKEVTVSDLEVEPFSKYVIGIVIEGTEGMYFPNGNSVGIYGNEDNTKVLCKFDIATDPIEFLVGYK